MMDRNFISKILITAFVWMVINPVSAQIENGSFEANDSTPSLEHWNFVCGKDTFKDAAPGGGNWCLKLETGNGQGCFPGYAFQFVPQVDSGTIFKLTGWAKKDSAFAQSFGQIGIYFATPDTRGFFYNFNRLKGDTTSSIHWDSLAVIDTFDFNTNDSVLVVLDAGLTGGPFFGQAFFDKIELEQIEGDTTTDAILFHNQDEASLTVDYDVFSKLLKLQISGTTLGEFSIQLYNVQGKLLEQQLVFKGTYSQESFLDLNFISPGSYFLNIANSQTNVIRKVYIGH